MLSDRERQALERFVAAQSEKETSPLDLLWAGRCAALLEELQRLEESASQLGRDVDALLEARRSDASESDTWVF